MDDQCKPNPPEETISDSDGFKYGLITLKVLKTIASLATAVAAVVAAAAAAAAATAAAPVTGGISVAAVGAVVTGAFEVVIQAMESYKEHSTEGGPDPVLMLNCTYKNFEAIHANKKAIQANSQAIAKNYALLVQIDQNIKGNAIKPILSNLKTFLGDFKRKSTEMQLLSGDELATRLEGPDGFLHFLKELLKAGKTGNLHALLHDIINQDLALPKKRGDELEFITLFLLFNGLSSYISMLDTLNAQYSILIERHFDKSELEKYNKLMSHRYDIYRDIAFGLVADKTGLIDKIVVVLQKFAALPLFASEEKVLSEVKIAIESLREIKESISRQIKTQFAEVAKRITVNPDFSKSKIRTPAMPNWIAGRKVAYAILFQAETVSKKQTLVSKWSNPYRIGSKACPTVTIPLDPQRRVRIIYRKFDSEGPQLVAIIREHNVTSFVDIHRDVFNLVKETSEYAIEEIEPFRKNGADLNAVFEKGRTSLHVAAASGNLELARYLIKHGALKEILDKNGYTPLHNAAFKGALKFVEGALAETLMDVNVLSYQLNTPLHSAVIGEQTQMVSFLLSFPKTDIFLVNYQGLNPFHLAASLGYISIIDTYATSKNKIMSKVINLPAKSGFTALHLAIKENFLAVTEVAKKLLELGALINVAGENHKTALHLAVAKKNVVFVKFLLEYGADVTSQTADLLTPLHFSILNYQPEVLKVLLEADAPVNQGNIEGITPLYYALQYKHTDAVNALVAKCAKVDLPPVNGRTQLHLAAAKGDANVVSGLIKFGADVNRESNFYKKFVSWEVDSKEEMDFVPELALDLALENGHMEVVEMLIKTNSKISFIFNSLENENDVAKSLSFLRNFELTEDQLLKLVEILKNENKNYQILFTKFSCERGFTRLLYAVNNNNITIVAQNCAEIAIKYGQVKLAKNVGKIGYKFYLSWQVGPFSGNLELFQYLEKFHQHKIINIHFFDNNKNTLLHLIAMNNHYEILKYVVNKIKNHFENEYLNLSNKTALVQEKLAKHLNFLNGKLQTPISLAVEHNADTKIVDFLLKSGAKLYLPRIDEKSDPFWAAKHGNLATVKLLISNGFNVDVINPSDGWTPLVAAIKFNGNLKMVTFLAEKGADLNRKLNHSLSRDITLANLALIVYKIDIAEYLMLEKKVKLAKAGFEHSDWSSLQEVAFRGSLKLAQFFLKEKDANLSFKDSQGRDALHCALSLSASNETAQRLQILKLFLENGGNINSTDNESISLLHRAILSGYSEAAVYLLKNGINFNTISKFWTTPHSEAIAKDDLLVVKVLLEKGQAKNFKVYETKSLEMLQLLLLYNADPLERNPSGLTLFEIAINEENNSVNFEKILRWYLFTFRSNSGGTVAHEVQSLPALKYFEAHGGNFNGLNIKHETPLHVAVGRNSSEAVKFILNANKCLNLEVKNIVQETAIDVAKRMPNNQKIRTMLEEKMSKKSSRVKREIKRKTDNQFSTVPKLFSTIMASVNDIAESVFSFFSSQLVYTPIRMNSVDCDNRSQGFANETQNSFLNLNSVAPFEVNSTLFLMDVLTRKFTGQKYIGYGNYFQTNELNIRSYALNLTEQFNKELEQVGSQYSLKRQIEIDTFKLFKKIETFAQAEQWSKIELLLWQKFTLVYPQLKTKF